MAAVCSALQTRYLTEGDRLLVYELRPRREAVKGWAAVEARLLTERSRAKTEVSQ